MTSAELDRLPDAAAAALLPAAGYANQALRELAEWVQAARSVTELVAPLVDTPFVPAHYRPNISDRSTPEEKAAARGVAIATATAAVLQGTKLGFDPLTALQQIYIVHGRPGMYARAKVALLLSKGHEVWTDDLSDHRAVVSGRRRGDTTVQTVTVTMDMARKAGWTTNPSKAYDKTPQDMLYARAAGRVCDRVAPEVLLGIESVEDIEDRLQATATTGSGTRTVSPRRALEAPPKATPAAPAESAQGDAERPLDEKQWRAINELMREQGIVGTGQKEARLARISEIVQRSIARGTDLTFAEGETILAELRRPPEPTVPAEPEVDEVEAVDSDAAGIDETGTDGASFDDELLDDAPWPAVPQIPTTDTEATP